ncbi:TBC1 domain family member 5 isoform X2 [Bacillus rossius redtenbacheri]|uniref:TBC1 domain family member 5 isoform X2 n=1 Tax=Bacillus rossius redtenbacheri TaxID=93214 RepID=UPI002FDED8C7
MNSDIATTPIISPDDKGTDADAADNSAGAATEGDAESSDKGSESCSDETSQDTSERSSSAQKYDVCWCCLLGVFPPDSSQWLALVRQHRQHYARLLRQVCVDPWDQHAGRDDDPLSQRAESVWHQHFCDKELRSVIRQDVVRTFPGVDFFRKESIQEAMVNILFCYARENPAMCYRQGMHEILAPLMFVLHCDHQALLHTKEQLSVSDVISEMLDPAYMEEDAYMLFAAIMGGLESCYRINDLTPTCTGYFPSSNSKSPDAGERPGENEVVSQLNWIRDQLLAPCDPQLHQHLLQLDIPLPLFGIRWLRLLFGREFPLQDLLVLWDAIFAEGRQFELVKFVVVAMLIAIRYQLLGGDYTTCLTYLMHYPGAVDISYIIEHALFLKDPQKHCAPAMTTFPNLPAVTVGGRADLNRAAGQDAGGPRRRDHPEPQVSKLSDRMRFLSTHSRKVKAVGRTAASNVESAVVDGYAVNDPVVLREELEHARVVMALCRIKLAQYHGILRKGVPHSAPSDVHQAIGGINELCALLGGRSHQAEVERACEAGEQRQRPARLPLPDKPPGARLPRGDVALKLFSQEEGRGEVVAGAPLPHPTLGW